MNLRSCRLAAVIVLLAVSPGFAVADEQNDAPPVSVRNFVLLEIRCTLPETRLLRGDELRAYPLRVDRPEAVTVLTEQTIRLTAVAVAPDTVLARDPGLSAVTIEEVKARSSDGHTGRARLVGRLKKLPALVFRLEGITAEPLTAADAVPPEGAFLSQTLFYVDEKWHLHGESSRPEPLWDDPNTLVVGTGLSDNDLDLALVLFSNRRAVIPAPAVITRNGSKPLAIGLTSGFYVRPDGSFPGTVPVAAPASTEIIPASEEEAVLEQVEATATRATVPVRIRFRKATGAEEPPQDVEALGLLVAGYVLVPGRISRAQAALIDEVLLSVSEDREVEGEFVGALRGFEAYVIRPPIDLPATLEPVSTDEEQLDMYEACIATNVRWSYGTRYFETRLTRPYNYRSTFFGNADYTFSGVVGDGTALWSPDGSWLGIVLQESFIYQQLAELLPPPPPSLAVYLSRHRPGDVFVSAARLTSMLRDIDRHLDPRIRVRKPGEELRRVWLGVEFTRVNRDLADALGCRQETRDGAIGLLVQMVYPGSPAERAGIRPGDILLALSVPELPMPIELTGVRRTTGNVRDIFERIMRARAMGGRRRPSGPWPSRDNYLTELLGVLGEGTPVRVVYWRDKKIQSVSTTLELAPPDQDSAPTYEDSTLGLTVKDLTYEVRAALRLADDAPGVVVADVESGSPAAQARLEPGEIIVDVDGMEIRTVEQFRSVIEKAREAGKASVRLRVMERGRSRFADMQLE